MFGLFLSAVKTKLFHGIYGPGVAVSHKSGLGTTFAVASPVCADRASPTIAKDERVESWECPSPPGMAGLVHRKEMQETMEGPVSFLLSPSERRRGTD